MTLDLSTMNTSELVSRFAKITLAQDGALLAKDHRRYRRLFEAMMDVTNELRLRPGDQRRELARLFDYPNMQVRVKAAIHALAVLPEESRSQLKTIAEAHWFPQTADAIGMLRALDSGEYKPE